MQKSDGPINLPDIPGKRYFTIGEVAELCLVKPHVLRYWEQEFPQLKPAKRRGNRRYYQQHDVQVVRKIRSLLYEHGFTISGAKQKLAADADNTLPKKPDTVRHLIDELECLLSTLSGSSLSS